jgi:hypothetical protein
LENKNIRKRNAARRVAATTAGAYHLLTIVRVFKPHLSCFNIFTATEATTLIAAIKPQGKQLSVNTV